MEFNVTPGISHDNFSVERPGRHHLSQVIEVNNTHSSMYQHHIFPDILKRAHHHFCDIAKNAKKKHYTNPK